MQLCSKPRGGHEESNPRPSQEGVSFYLVLRPLDPRLGPGAHLKTQRQHAMLSQAVMPFDGLQVDASRVYVHTSRAALFRDRTTSNAGRVHLHVCKRVTRRYNKRRFEKSEREKPRRAGTAQHTAIKSPCNQQTTTARTHIQPHCTTNTATNDAPCLCHVMTSTLAPPNQHHNANPAHAR